MRKLFIPFLIVFFLLVGLNVVSADRNTPTTRAYQTSTLLKTGDAKVYSITFVASTANGEFILFDATSMPTSVTTLTTTKAEGKEGVVGNSKFYDFSNKPLEFSTGLYLYILTGTVVIRYE